MNIGLKVKRRYSEFKQIAKRDGVVSALGVVVHYVFTNPKQAITFEGRNYQTETRVDLEERWNLIEENMDPKARNTLDIGCSQGELTKRAADMGHLAVGVDRIKPNIVDNNKRFADNDDLKFFSYELSPDNIPKLPDFDIMFLLTVYYHWGREYGWEDAEEMLRTVAEKTDQLFFETPKNNKRIKSNTFQNIEQDTITEQHRQYLKKTLGREFDVEYLGTTAYKGEERKDLLFVIESS